MSEVNETIHLLILDNSENDAEKMVSLLRNAGISTRAKRIKSEEELIDALEEQAWDLFIARQEEADFDLNQALVHIQQKDRDIPFFVLSKNYDHEDVAYHLKAGAKDVIPFDSDKHIVAAVKRELGNLVQRKKLRQMEVTVRDAEQRCELLLDSSKDAIAYISDGMHIYANGSYLNLLGYDEIDEMICIPVLDTLANDSQEAFKTISKSFFDNKESEKIASIPCVSRREDGNEIEAIMNFSEASYDSERCLQVVVRPQQDGTELEEKLKRMSQLDLLTGLYNRQYFMEQLLTSKESALKDQNQFAVLYLSFDNFQRIKSEIGIADVDLVLRDLAKTLTKHTSDQADKQCTLARLSDDVFGVVCSCQGQKEAIQIGEQYLKRVEENLFEVGGKTMQITLSIGITLVTDNAPNVNDILGRAQTASLEVRGEEGHEDGNGVLLYTPKNDGAHADNDLASTLIQEALDNDKFKLLFQPIISLRGQSGEHYEAFIRMVNDKGEDVSPYEFLPPGGPVMMANKIDKWVILQTIKHLGEHRSGGHDTKLFINLTAETLQDKTFTSWLNVALEAARLPGDSLIFQISEAHAITYLKQTKEFAKGIDTLHCKLSINQFGRALNPFNLLKHLEPEYIKLEGSFTKDMQKDQDAKENAKEMIKTLQSMGKLTIVPLVESASLLSILWQAGVNYIQGYYLQAPTAEMNYDFTEEN